MWQEQPVIRISVCSWQTTTKDVDQTVNTFVESRTRAQVALSKQDAE